MRCVAAGTVLAFGSDPAAATPVSSRQRAFCGVLQARRLQARLKVAKKFTEITTKSLAFRHEPHFINWYNIYLNWSYKIALVN